MHVVDPLLSRMDYIATVNKLAALLSDRAAEAAAWHDLRGPVRPWEALNEPERNAWRVAVKEVLARLAPGTKSPRGPGDLDAFALADMVAQVLSVQLRDALTLRDLVGRPLLPWAQLWDGSHPSSGDQQKWVWRHLAGDLLEELEESPASCCSGALPWPDPAPGEGCPRCDTRHHRAYDRTGTRRAFGCRQCGAAVDVSEGS